MTYCDRSLIYSETPRREKRRESWLDLPVIQLLLASLYFILGFHRYEAATPSIYTGGAPETPSRSNRRKHAYAQRKAAFPARNLSPLRALMPGGTSGSLTLSRAQFLERCTKLSAMGRFQIYGFHYYRDAFRRVSLVRHIGRKTQNYGAKTHSFASALVLCEHKIPP